MTTVIVAVLAQLLATAILIFVPELYSKTHSGNEAWPVIIPTLIIAFVLETLFLFMTVPVRKGVSLLLKLSFGVFASWIAGVVTFLFLDVFARSFFVKPPIVAWLACLAILVVMAKRVRVDEE